MDVWRQGRLVDSCVPKLRSWLVAHSGPLYANLDSEEYQAIDGIQLVANHDEGL
jgi:hypothetical protein